MAGGGKFSQLTAKMPPKRCIERMTEELREEMDLAQLRMARKATTGTYSLQRGSRAGACETGWRIAAISANYALGQTSLHDGQRRRS